MKERLFGNIDGSPITEYTLSNAGGMQVGIINYGGTVTRLLVPDKNGEMGDVVLGYASLNGYLQQDNPYFNSLIGRYANRIANARFTLDGKEYTLAPNNNGNSLHGGYKGYDKVIWDAEKLNDTSLKLTYVSNDGEEGYPGNLHITVIYTLTSDNGLQIDYFATTDQATPINLTSHCYFNLSAGKDPAILNHRLQLNASKYTVADDALVPTGELADVQGGPMDFTTEKLIGDDIQQVKGGYDHNWVLDNNGNTLEKAATLYEPVSGRYMEVYTTQPGIQFYSGNFLNGILQDTKNGQVYGKHAALCLETQHFPDSPNQPHFPNTILRPGEAYRQTTVYRFSIQP
ncbi:MAG TPA: aldose epimerase family protein [Chitinophagaceae bacterium]|nr:aldose epimerase family protein [Chitinophagaceae bacterium]